MLAAIALFMMTMMMMMMMMMLMMLLMMMMRLMIIITMMLFVDGESDAKGDCRHHMLFIFLTSSKSQAPTRPLLHHGCI